MFKKRFVLKSVALTAAIFLALLALPLTGALAAGTAITISSTDQDYYEGGSEYWQSIGTFTIDSSHLPITSAQLVINANDVDAPAETDIIRIRDGVGGTQVLGNLTGMDDQDNTTVFVVPVSFLVEGTYTLELNMGSTYDGVFSYQGGWWVNIHSATLLLNGGASSMAASVSFTASGTAVNTTLNLSSLLVGYNYTIEYKFTNITAGRQIGSGGSAITNNPNTTAQVSQLLDLDSDDAIVDDAIYQLDAVITETPRVGMQGSVNIVTASATSGQLLQQAPTYHKITITSNEGGSFSPSSPTFALSGGDAQEISFLPDPGYAIEDVTIDGVSQGAVQRYQFNDVYADHTVAVTFIPLATPPQTGSATIVVLAALALLGAAGCFMLARKKSENA